MLESVKVLSFTHYMQGPSTVQALAYLGADVIKVESATGAFERHWSGVNSFKNGVSVYFLFADRNQRSISVNLKTAEGKEIIYQLAKTTDVVVENFRPGVMDRMGFGYEDFKKINPGVIYCSCSGYGSSGPYRDRPGQDLLAQAMSGLMTITGKKSDPPIPVGTAIADQHAARLASVGILAALIARKKTGVGCKIESNLLNASLDLQREPLSYAINGYPLYERSESGIGSRYHQAPYGVYQTADGYLCLSMISLKQLAQLFNDDTFLSYTDAQQFSKREEINRKVVEHMHTSTTAQWMEKMDALGIWYAPINTYEQVEKDPQVQWNKSIFEFDHPVAGHIRMLGHPVKYDGQRLPLRRLPPNLGEHTVEVLRELGYEEEKIQHLLEQSVVVQG